MSITATLLEEGAAPRRAAVDLIDLDQHHVRVIIKATGLCHSDLSVIDGVVPHPKPCVLGHEGAGIVEAVGDAVTSVQPGDHVILSWIPACGSCWYCLRGESYLCARAPERMANPGFRFGGEPAFGLAGLGTFAEALVVPDTMVVQIGGDIPFEVAAIVGCGVMTGYGASVHAGKVQPGQSVVVIGTGGVGISAVQGARVAGAAIIVAVDPVEGRRSAALRSGATHAVPPEQLAEALAGLTGGRGFDVAIEAVGRAATAEATVSAVRRGGAAVLVGAAPRDAGLRLNISAIVSSGKQIVGCSYGSGDVRRDFSTILELWKSGRLDLDGMITDRRPLSELNEAIAAMHAGQGLRTVLDPSA